MNILEALRTYPKLEEADLLLAHILRVTKEYLYMNPGQELSKSEVTKFQKICLSKVEGVPSAYLINYKYFYGLKFKVTSDVLIPRPESEWLVDQAAQHIRNLQNKRRNKTWRIIDMGTGSGCLITSLAKTLEGSRMDLIGVDISSAALKIAKTNAAYHSVKVNFIKSDLFKKTDGIFEVVMANLPYVSRKDFRVLQPTLAHEPALAITTNDDTWEIYKRFLQQLPKYITEGSLVLIEIDPKQKSMLEIEIIKRLPHATYEFSKDIHKLWRYCLIKI